MKTWESAEKLRCRLPPGIGQNPPPVQVGNHLPPGVVLDDGGAHQETRQGIWLREIEKVLRRFDASLEWLMERISLRDEEMDMIRADTKMEEREKSETLRTLRTKSIAEVLEEVEVLVDTHFFNEFSETKSSQCLKKVIAHQSAIDLRLFRKTWRSLNCSPKTMKVIREIKENLLCVGKRKELITKKKADSMCWCSKSGLALNSKHIVSCCKRVGGEINARHDAVVNILLNNILKQRGLISHEQKWEDRKTVRTARDENAVGTEHPRSDEWKNK